MDYRLIGRITLTLLTIISLVVSCAQKQEETKAGSATQEQTQPQVQKQTTPESQAQQPSPDQATTSTPVAAATVELSGVEKRLADTLLLLWQAKGHMTSADQAAAMLGITVTDGMRANLLKYLLQNTAASEKLGRYRPYTFVLSNPEKLIAQYVVVSQKKNTEFPTLKQVATDLKLSENEVNGRLKFLSSVGLFYDLGGASDLNKLGYSFGPEVSDFMYDMGLRFHEFQVDNGLSFNVGCAKEALFMVNSEFSHNRVRYSTVDPLTLAPIEVVFDNALVASLSPEGAMFLEGGSCGANNLFASQDNAVTWANSQPHLRQQVPQPVDVRERLAQIAEQLRQTESGK